MGPLGHKENMKTGAPKLPRVQAFAAASKFAAATARLPEVCLHIEIGCDTVEQARGPHTDT